MSQPPIHRIILLLFALPLACASPPESRDEGYALEVVIPGDGIHGLHGLTFDDRDRLYAGGVMVSNIFRIDTATGDAEVFIPGPEGNADDLEFAPDGTLVWTSFMLGKVHARKGDGPIRVLAEGLPGMNSMAFDARGRLFATQVFLGDALYEIDLAGEKPPRKIIEGMGGLNGFDFGPDGRLYGPLWFKGQIARIDVDAGTLEVVAEGFETPAAVNFNSRGELFALDTSRGEIVRLDPESGQRERVWRTPTAMDNLAIDSRDQIYFSVFPENAIFRLDPGTGALHEVRSSALGIPGALAIWRGEQAETIYVADGFAIRSVELPDHGLRELARSLATKLESASAGISVSKRFIHLANWAGGAVQRLDRESGEVSGRFTGFETPAAVLELEDGSLLVAQFESGELVRLDPDGERSVVAAGLDAPVAIAAAGSDAVYVALHGSGRVERVGLEDGARELVARDLEAPEGLAVGPEGRLFVSEGGAARITRVDPQAGRQEVIASGLPLGLDVQGSMPGPGLFSGIAVAADGSVYFSSDIEAALYRLRPR